MGGNHGGGNHSPYDGTYVADFTSASDNAMLVFVQRDNSAELTISNDAGVDYAGTGTLDPGNLSFIGTATSVYSPTPVQIMGTVVAGNPNALNLTLTGGVAATVHLNLVGAEDMTIFAGTYTLTATPDPGRGVGGTGTITIGTFGDVSGTITPTGGSPMSLSGTITPDGSGSYQDQGAGPADTIVFQGGFWIHNGVKQSKSVYNSIDNPPSSSGATTCTQ